MNTPRLCCARDALLYGSRACTAPTVSNHDTCARHGAMLLPHRLINGTLYIDCERDELDDCTEPRIQRAADRGEHAPHMTPPPPSRSRRVKKPKQVRR